MQGMSERPEILMCKQRGRKRIIWIVCIETDCNIDEEKEGLIKFWRICFEYSHNEAKQLESFTFKSSFHNSICMGLTDTLERK